MGVKKKVVVFGGGIGGLSTAHELTEPGRAAYFDVEVIEADTVYGGKARSQDVPGDPPEANGYPGEHGFRFFPRFYRHVIDTMQRIPSAYPTPARASVADHLVGTPSRMVTRYGLAPIVMPSAPDLGDPKSIVTFFLQMFGSGTGLTKADVRWFVSRLLRLGTSCKERRLGQYETQSWWDFLDAGNRSLAFQTYLARGLTRTLVAAKPDEINAMTGGDVLIRLLVDSATAADAVKADRVLDGPTSRVWIKPWYDALVARGVTFTEGALVSLEMAPGGDTITAATYRRPDNTLVPVQPDYCVCALPVERMAAVLDVSPAVRMAGERLAGITTTLRHDIRSMTGLQFYLDQPLQKVPPDLGHQLHVDSQWALTSIAQSTFWRWPFDDLTVWGAGDVKQVFSAIVSDWKSPFPPGANLPAENCSRDELRDDTVAQLVLSLNENGSVQRFDPASIVAWNLDASLTPGTPSIPATNTMQLLVNHPDRWKQRPDPAPQGLRNLMLAADYVRTNTDLATMEGANEAARVAVNAILGDAGVAGQDCELFELYFPEVLADRPFWKEWIAFDRTMYTLYPNEENPFSPFDPFALVGP